jgi:hypothetical protein
MSIAKLSWKKVINWLKLLEKAHFQIFKSHIHIISGESTMKHFMTAVAVAASLVTDPRRRRHGA